MTRTFNDLLADVGIQPSDVWLIRHADRAADRDRKPHLLWATNRSAFEAYQSIQKEGDAASLRRRPYWAVFLGLPGAQTQFVGLYENTGDKHGKARTPAVARSGHLEPDPHVVFDLRLLPTLSGYTSKLFIEWGGGYVNWYQRADKQNKSIEIGT
jgi:hypothetical protein